MKIYKNRMATLRGWCGEGVEKQKTLPFIVVTIRSRSSPPSTLSAKTIVYLQVKVQQSAHFIQVWYPILNNDIIRLVSSKVEMTYEVSPMSTTSAQPLDPSIKYK
jgi:hypothetical protein